MTRKNRRKWISVVLSVFLGVSVILVPVQSVAEEGSVQEKSAIPTVSSTQEDQTQPEDSAPTDGETDHQAEGQTDGEDAKSHEDTAATDGETAEIEEGSVPDSTDSSGLDITAKSAVLIDAKTGTVLYEKNAYESLPPASVTKVMSMLLVMEAVDSGQITLEDKVTISDRAAKMGGSQLFMEPGEQHTVAELMKGIAMASANDGCVALAEYVGGSETGFVQMMNDRAQELGMKNTLFQNTNGLPVANHYSSAYDIALMSKELMTHEAVRPWLVTWMDKMTVGLEGKQTEFGLANTNKLIKQYPGATGIKTGFTADAKYCLSGAAQKDNMELIGVILGADSSDVRFKEMASLLDYGFALYDSVRIAEKDVPLQQLRVEKGSVDLINAVPKDNIDVLVKKDEKQLLTHEIQMDKKINAPIAKGDKVGTLVVLKDGKPEGTFDLVSDMEVEKSGPIAMFLELFNATFR